MRKFMVLSCLLAGSLGLPLFSPLGLSFAQSVNSSLARAPRERHGRNVGRDDAGLTDPYPNVRQPNSSNAVETTNVASAGLIINATFDSSITSNANAAAIEAAINQAVATYQSLFSDNVTVNILFKYTSISGALARSSFVVYDEDW
ncbi:MAG TPA: hypothetical protein VGM62_19645, partial [Chthoniobacterales bacterium]